ncbi:MAG TPA: superoxide dismutase family protein [Thermoanaerobaculia bacterium]|nr:superoxide dismutase family protein [Thermoanaerobaculia bacterium]
MRFRILSSVVLGAAGVFVLGCASGGASGTTAASGGTSSPAAASAASAASARATLESRSGSTVTGTATFTELSSGGVRVRVHVENAPPGTHGLHVHEKGDCSDPEAKSAGGHFNPGGMPHAGPMADKRHAGDLGNIEIGANGKGDLDVRTDLLTVKSGPNSVVGKAVIFHEKADDLATQPTGNAGGRLACGVVQ